MIAGVFASDLDRTLIFSQTAMEQLDIRKVAVTVMEYKHKEALSFMSDSALGLLQQIRKHLLFIPITTRTFAQYRRIEFPFAIRYAVVANGAEILYNGQRLRCWEEDIKRKVVKESGSQEELKMNIGAFALKGTVRDGDGWFFYYVLKEPLTEYLLEEIRLIATRIGWRISLQGRKLYFMPNAISKGKALQYIVEKEGSQHIFGAGDSLLDDDFLRICHEAYVPLHGELAQHIKEASHWLTREKGMMATEELLSKILQKIINLETQTNEIIDLV